MKLVVVRHGQAGGNQKKVIMSQRDVGLTDFGKAQAQELVKKLDKYQFDSIYSSPLSRAVNTAKPFAEKRNQKVQLDDRLKEVDFGDFIGKPEESTIKAIGQSIDDMYMNLQYDLTQYGGESDKQVRHRVENFLSDLKNSGAQNVLVVTHEGIVHWLHYLISGEKMGVAPNLSILEFNL